LLPSVTRREFLRTGAATTAIFLAAPGRCSEKETAPPNDQELLSEARASIDRYRKGDAVVRIRQPNGASAQGLKITVEQLAHEFLFGCNLFCFGRCADAEQEREYRQRFADLFNYATLGFYWASFEFERGKPLYDYIERVLEWTGAQKIRCKGHPLVWDHPAGSPPWLPDDPGEIARLVVGRVRELVTRYRGRIDVWDVVNEATHLPNGVNQTKMAAWGAALGSVPYTAEPLRVARSANREATLLVNDYRLDSAYFDLLTKLREGGKPLFNTVGLQSHMHDGAWPVHKLVSICQQFGPLGLPLHFTETTILSGRRNQDKGTWDASDPESEASQADAVARFYTTLFAQPAVRAITWWDFSDYHSWQRAPAGLVREDMSPKPAYDQLLKLIKREWWTKTTGKTDEKGTLAFRGFHGNYRVIAETSNGHKTIKEFALLRGKANPFEIEVES
jgi:endo-1,4-beta-xylanase